MIDLTHHPIHFKPRVSANYFFDTEFYQPDKDNIELISIGVVCADGREFYAVSDEFDERTMGFWVRRHVVKKLGTRERMPIPEIARRLDLFVADEPHIRFFVKGGDGKDWQMLTHIFGGEKYMPARFPRHFSDIEAIFPKPENPEDLPPHTGTKHNALDDALWTRSIWWFHKTTPQPKPNLVVPHRAPVHPEASEVLPEPLSGPLIMPVQSAELISG